MFSGPGVAVEVDMSAEAIGVGGSMLRDSGTISAPSADVDDSPERVGEGVSELSILMRVGKGVATSETPSGKPAPDDNHACQSFNRLDQSVDHPGSRAKPATSPTNTIDTTPSRRADHGLPE